jgi:hypothetical protein
MDLVSSLGTVYQGKLAFRETQTMLRLFAVKNE